MALNLIEKKTLMGMGGIILFVGISLYEIGKRNLWFEKKNTYYTYATNAEGLRPGSTVTIAGLRVGDVTSLDVDADNRIRVTLEVKEAVANRLRADARAMFVRLFVIGEKRIELIPGSPELPVLTNRATLEGREQTDLSEFVTGTKLAEMMGHVQQLIGGLNIVVSEMHQIFDRYKSGEFEATIQRVEPALSRFIKLADDLLVMTGEMKKSSKQLPVFVDSGAKVFSGAKTDLFDNKLFRDSMTQFNSMARPMTQVLTPFAEREKLLRSLLDNLQNLSQDLEKNPDFAKETMTALRELTVTLRALQRTWLLEDATNEVRKETLKKK